MKFLIIDDFNSYIVEEYDIHDAIERYGWNKHCGYKHIRAVVSLPEEGDAEWESTSSTNPE